MTQFLQYYLQGKGLDTSKQPVIAAAKHCFKEANNLYRFLPEEGMQFEEYDYVYNENQINETKFAPILIKEWFGLVKVGGYLVVRFTPNTLLNMAEFIDLVNVLLVGKGEILHRETSQQMKTFIIRKTQGLLHVGDDMTKWSFGIVTRGDRNDWMEKIIQRIRELRVPKYEIIVCGKYYDRKEFDVNYIHFEEKDDLGWITKKKNLICEAAQFENIYVTNDRIIPELSWYEGMKKYGNYFDSLGCVQKLANGQRVGDWMTFGTECKKTQNIPFTLGLLDYRDWDKWSYVVGSLNILKKSVWKKNPWDENLFWVDSIEDGVFCHELYKKGYLTRFNPYAEALSLSWRHGLLPTYTFNASYLGKRTGAPVRRFGWAILRICAKLGWQKTIMSWLYKAVVKLGLYKFIANH